MNTFERILFPVDFSERCDQASCFVSEIARTFGSEVTLLHVFEGFDSLELGVGSRYCESEVCERLVQHRDHRLKTFATGCFEGVTVHRLIKCGEAAECIEACARDHSIDLIVMPTHGHGRFRRMLAGSVSLKVLHDAQCSVWTTAHSAALPARPPFKIRNILCAVDLGPESSRVVCLAADLAVRYKASLHVGHAISMLEKTTQTEATRVMNDLVKDVTQDLGTEVSFDTLVSADSLRFAFNEWTQQISPDLVVLGHGHVQRRFGEFWSHLATTIHESPCPVLSV